MSSLIYLYLPNLHFSVQLSYSTNFGETWHELHKPCLPDQCNGEYFPITTNFKADYFDG